MSVTIFKKLEHESEIEGHMKLKSLKFKATLIQISTSMPQKGQVDGCQIIILYLVEQTD